ncbi:MAG: hypothetical protein R3Y12_04170 [Clostridia bacterium]
MKIKVNVLEPILKNGKWELIEYEREEEVLHPDREAVLCKMCRMKSYPKCKEWCNNHKSKDKSRD